MDSGSKLLAGVILPGGGDEFRCWLRDCDWRRNGGEGKGAVGGVLSGGAARGGGISPENDWLVFPLTCRN